MLKGGSVVVLLTVLLAILKLSGVVSWSWFWVLSPIWASLAWLCFIMFLLVLDNFLKS